jgi:hypothetical protein
MRVKAPTRIAALSAFWAMALVADARASPIEGQFDRREGQIFLRGVVEPHCAIAVSALPASELQPFATTGLKRIVVNTVLQNCNRKTGFRLTAASAVCALTPAGGKDVETVSQGTLPYSMESYGAAGEGTVASVAEFSVACCSTAIDGSVETVGGGTSTLYVSFYVN